MAGSSALPASGTILGLSFHVTRLLAVRAVASGAVTTLGVYYLGVGRKRADAGAMIQGAALVLAGFLLFL